MLQKLARFPRLFPGGGECADRTWCAAGALQLRIALALAPGNYLAELLEASEGEEFGLHRHNYYGVGSRQGVGCQHSEAGRAIHDGGVVCVAGACDKLREIAVPADLASKLGFCAIEVEVRQYHGFLQGSILAVN